MSRLPDKSTAGYTVPMPKDEFIRVRIEPAVRKALEKEAKDQGRDLSNYIRRLIDTHPDRQVKKSK